LDWNIVFFSIWPYISLALFFGVTIYRSIFRPFTISSLSSQLLENKRLFWGSISFHYGIVLVLIGHLLSLTIPRAVVLWNSVPLRLYLSEISGLVMGVWGLIGLGVLVYRRVTVSRIRVVTTPMDIVTLIVLLVSLVTGVLVAAMYRGGTMWFTGIFSPYLASLVTFAPRLDLVIPLPFLVKLHVINNFLLAAIFPFSRLVHIFTYPIGYLIRPWQIVLWNRKIRPQNNP